MKSFVAIIGGRNSGKATVICSLTGCERHCFRGIVADRQNNQGIYVIADPPQDSGLSLDELNRILKQVLNNNSILGVIIAVIPSYPRSHLSMEDIFNAAKLAGDFNLFAIMLYPPYNYSHRADVEDVRARLQEIGLELNVLNGQRFAHLNACDIRALTGLP